MLPDSGCSGAGGSDVQLVPGPDPAGPQTAVVYLHAIRPRGSARVTVRPG